MNIPSIRDNPIMYIGILVGFEQAISGGTIHLTDMIPANWIPHATAWATALAFIGNGFMTALAAPGMRSPPTTAVAKALAWLILPLALVLLMGSPAGAQTPRPRRPLTGDIPADIQNLRNNQGQPGGLLAGEKAVQNTPCDFNFFTALTQRNLGDQLRICANTKFAKDIQSAIDSAKAKDDKPALACLEPGLEIIKAAVGTEIPPAADSPPGTAPIIEAPGLVLIFQKFREFGTANGVASCKAYITTTIAFTNPIGQ